MRVSAQLKNTSWQVCPWKTQISLRMRAVWSESSIGTLLVAKGSTFLQAKKQRSFSSLCVVESIPRMKMFEDDVYSIISN